MILHGPAVRWDGNYYYYTEIGSTGATDIYLAVHQGEIIPAGLPKSLGEQALSAGATPAISETGTRPDEATGRRYCYPLLTAVLADPGYCWANA